MPETGQLPALDPVTPAALEDAADPGLRQSLAGTLALRAWRRLPPGIRFGSLRISASGEYILEGLSPSADVVSLFSFLDTLKALPSDVSLSYWREGRVDAERFYRFAFEGRFPHAAGVPLERLGRAAASQLLGQLPGRARASGLDSIATEPPVDLGPTVGGVHRRQKLWATGSQQQIADFADAVEGLGPRLSMGEMLVVPLPDATGRRGGRARLYAALDLVVASADQ
jgi:hypothetical protein